MYKRNGHWHNRRNPQNFNSRRRLEEYEYIDHSRRIVEVEDRYHYKDDSNYSEIKPKRYYRDNFDARRRPPYQTNNRSYYKDKSSASCTVTSGNFDNNYKEATKTGRSNNAIQRTHQTAKNGQNIQNMSPRKYHRLSEDKKRKEKSDREKLTEKHLSNIQPLEDNVSETEQSMTNSENSTNTECSLRGWTWTRQNKRSIEDAGKVALSNADASCNHLENNEKKIKFIDTDNSPKSNLGFIISDAKEVKGSGSTFSDANQLCLEQIETNNDLFGSCSDISSSDDTEKQNQKVPCKSLDNKEGNKQNIDRIRKQPIPKKRSNTFSLDCEDVNTLHKWQSEKPCNTPVEKISELKTNKVTHPTESETCVNGNGNEEINVIADCIKSEDCTEDPITNPNKPVNSNNKETSTSMETVTLQNPENLGNESLDSNFSITGFYDKAKTTNSLFQNVQNATCSYQTENQALLASQFIISDLQNQESGFGHHFNVSPIDQTLPLMPDANSKEFKHLHTALFTYAILFNGIKMAQKHYEAYTERCSSWCSQIYEPKLLKEESNSFKIDLNKKLLKISGDFVKYAMSGLIADSMISLNIKNLLELNRRNLKVVIPKLTLLNFYHIVEGLMTPCVDEFSNVPVLKEIYKFVRLNLVAEDCKKTAKLSLNATLQILQHSTFTTNQPAERDHREEN